MKFIALSNMFAHLVNISSSISVIISFSFSLLFYFYYDFLAVAVFAVVFSLHNVIIIVINVFVVTFNVVVKLLFEYFIIVIFFCFFFEIGIYLMWCNVFIICCLNFCYCWCMFAATTADDQFLTVSTAKEITDKHANNTFVSHHIILDNS